MRPHSAQALAHTLTLLLALAGAVGHGVFLSALIDLDANVFGSTLGIVTVVEIAWLVILALYLISTMLAPKNARFIWVITDVCLLLAFAAVGLGATIALVIANYVHLDACHKKYGEPCSASVGGGAVSFVVVVILIASAIVEARYATKHHGRAGWWSSLRAMGQKTSGFVPVSGVSPYMASAPRQPRQGTFVPLVVVNDNRIRSSKEYQDLPLLDSTARPSSRSSNRAPSGSGSSVTSMVASKLKRSPSVFSQSSERSAKSDGDPHGPLAPLVPQDSLNVAAPMQRRFSDRMEELRDEDSSSLRSTCDNPQAKQHMRQWRPDTAANNVAIGTAV